jgi:dolichol kinase
LRRKAIHLASGALPIFYHFTNQLATFAVLAILLAIAISMEAIRFGHAEGRGWIRRSFGSLFRAEESSTLTGATYVILANLLAIAIFPKPVAIAALLFLSISDALASLVGRKFGRTRLFGKSLAGSLAFLLSALAIGVIVFPGQPWPAVAGALTATVIEALPLRLGRIRIDDNFAIPLAAGTVMWLM